MIKQQAYRIGVVLFILSLMSSVLNDVISKYVCIKLHSTQVVSFRFAFSALTLLPFIIHYGSGVLKSTNHFVHFIRGVLLFIGIIAWTYGLTVTHISTATAISFTIPIFVLILATFSLKERIRWQRWVATLIGFGGILVILQPHTLEFNAKSLILVLAAGIFASLDIINKKFATQESMISMLFYPSIIATILAIPAAFYNWQAPSIQDLSYLFALGVSSNVILFLILKAFTFIDASAAAPYRYLELLMSCAVGYLLFEESPKTPTLYGVVVIIVSTLFIVYSENHEMPRKTQ